MSDEEPVFAFNGQSYPSYQEMVDAKRLRNANVLAKSGLLDAKTAVDAIVAREDNNNRRKLVRGLKRSQVVVVPSSREVEPLVRRKSSRLAGDDAPRIYIDSESGVGGFVIAGSEAGSLYKPSVKEHDEKERYYNGRVNDGSDLTIAESVELTGPKWSTEGSVERAEDFVSRILPDIIEDMPIVSPGKRRGGSSPTSVSDGQASTVTSKSSSSTDDLRKLDKLSLEDMSTKVCPERIMSVTCHPSPNRLIVCAGDKLGHLGIWNVDQYGVLGKEDVDSANGGVHLFKPYSGAISTVVWNGHGTTLLSSSYDGSVRLFDVECQVFEEVFATYGNEASFKGKIGYNTNHGYNSWIQSMELDHRFDSGKCFFLSTSEGGVMHIDLRLGGKLTFNRVLSEKKINTVSLHPNGNVIATAGLTGVVQLWDVRKVEVKKEKPKPLSWQEAGRSINSAFFSPSGRRLLTTTQSNKLEIFEDAHLDTGLIQPKSSVRHDNQTGRWLSTFMARWHPGSSSLDHEIFVVGSMQQPRCIEIFGHTGEVLREIRGGALTAVASRCCFHPSTDRLIVVGGNSSGRVTIAR